MDVLNSGCMWRIFVLILVVEYFISCAEQMEIPILTSIYSDNVFGLLLLKTFYKCVDNGQYWQGFLRRFFCRYLDFN